MSEKPLLLSSAKSGVLVRTLTTREYFFWALVALGVFAVVVGAVNLLSHCSNVLGNDTGFVAFAPAAALADPNIMQAVSGVAATSSPIAPARLRIPAIGVDASVESVGKKADGSMATPQKFDDVAWYALGSKPGDAGNAVFAGHVNNALTKAGVFEHLGDLKVGDYVTVADASGKTLVYRVSEVDEYPADTAPAASIFATSGPSQVVLITCDGEWVQSAHSFDKRLVIVARLAQ